MKRICCFMMTVLCFLVLGMNASAEEIHTELSTPEEFSQWSQSDSSTYSTLTFVRRTGIVGGADKITYFSLMEIDGTLVYCIEPHVYAATGQNYEIDWGILDEYTKQRLFNITNVGYGRYGHNDDRWFVATQLVIWRALGYNQYYAQTMDGAYWDLSAEMAEIEQMANSFGNTASFSGQTLTLDLNEPCTVKDSHGILSQFHVQSVKGVDVVQEGNEMTVTIVDRDYQKSLSGSKGITTGGLVYVHPGKQTVYMVHRSEEPISYQLKLKLNTVNLRLLKQDPYGNIASKTHHFQMYDENGNVVLDDIVIEDGVADINGYLTKGTYVLKETSTMYPYVLSSDEQTIELSEKNQEVIVVNELAKIDLHLIKKDAETLELLDGAVFTVSIKDEEGNWIPWKEEKTGGKYLQVDGNLAGTAVKLMSNENTVCIGEFAVDMQGRIEVNDCILDDIVVMDKEDHLIPFVFVDHTGTVVMESIEYGKQLQICETMPPEGYLTAEDACRVIVVDNESLIQEEVFYNEKRHLNVQLIKCDRTDNRLLLNDAYFMIENLNTGKLYNAMSGRLVIETEQPYSIFQVYRDAECMDLIFEEISDESGQWIGIVDEKEVYVRLESHSEIQHYFIEEGAVFVEDVTYGDVLRVCEVIAPSGYHRNEECQMVDVKSQDDLLQVWFENERIRVYDEVPTMGVD